VATGTARELLGSIRAETADIDAAIRSHRWLDALERGAVPRSSLEAFAGEQYAILHADRRSFAQLAARFPMAPAGDLFLGLAEGEGRALAHLLAFAGGLDLDVDALRGYRPRPGCQAYSAYVAWLALNGSRADVALAFVANLDAWGESCLRMSGALRREYGLADEALTFFDFFSGPPPEFEEKALLVAGLGLRNGDSAEAARRAARLLQAYELMYWDGLAADL
jgi:thiaminase